MSFSSLSISIVLLILSVFGVISPVIGLMRIVKELKKKVGSIIREAKIKFGENIDGLVDEENHNLLINKWINMN